MSDTLKESMIGKLRAKFKEEVEDKIISTYRDDGVKTNTAYSKTARDILKKQIVNAAKQPAEDKWVPKKKFAEEVELEEGRPSQQHPIEGHSYHSKSNAELHYIIKDAGAAAKAQKGMSSEGKYLDQQNDASTVLGFRQRATAAKGGSLPDWYVKKYLNKNVKEAFDAEKHAAEMKKMSGNTKFLPKLTPEDIAKKREEIANRKPAKRPLDNRGIDYVDRTSGRAYNEEVELDEALKLHTPESLAKQNAKNKAALVKKYGENFQKKPKKPVEGMPKLNQAQATESVEYELQELSKNTLTSYKKKAIFDLKSSTSRLNTFEPELRSKNPAKDHKMSQKRVAGINAANRQLNKEEVEMNEGTIDFKSFAKRQAAENKAAMKAKREADKTSKPKKNVSRTPVKQPHEIVPTHILSMHGNEDKDPSDIIHHTAKHYGISTDDAQKAISHHYGKDWDDDHVAAYNDRYRDSLKEGWVDHISAIQIHHHGKEGYGVTTTANGKKITQHHDSYDSASKQASELHKATGKEIKIHDMTENFSINIKNKIISKLNEGDDPDLTGKQGRQTAGMGMNDIKRGENGNKMISGAGETIKLANLIAKHHGDVKDAKKGTWNSGKYMRHAQAVLTKHPKADPEHVALFNKHKSEVFGKNNTQPVDQFS